MQSNRAGTLSIVATAGLLLLHAGLHVYGVLFLISDLEAASNRLGDLRATWIYAGLCGAVAVGLLLRRRVAWAIGMWLTMIMGVSEILSMLMTHGEAGIDRIPLMWYGEQVGWATALTAFGALVGLLLAPTTRALKRRAGA